MIHQIKNASKDTYSLLDNLLQWASSQRGTMPYSPDEVTLYDLVLKITLNIKSQAEQKDISIRINIPLITRVFCDVDMISTVIRNLVSNAIKFTPRGGIVEIGKENYSSDDLKSSDESNSITIYIKDSGIGMTQDTLSKLFRIESKVSHPGTNNEKGSGLGLILCKEFVEKHCGKIWVESAVGKGSTFYFTLPMDIL
jgi:signal transduction histidine kinase